jgi:phenylacetate-CoA ligase
MTGFEKYEGLEKMDSGEMRRAQEGLLREHLAYVAARSPFYRDLFLRNGVDPARTGLDRLADLPFTDKSDLEGRNDDFLAVPMAEVSDIVLSSGTTGKPTRIMYSRGDLDRLAFNEKTAFERAGLNSSDIVLLTCTMDRCFIAGLAYYYGAREVGAATIRNGLSSPASHMEVISRLRPTVLVGVPSFLVKLGGFMRERGMEPRTAGVRTLVCIGEPTRDRDMNLTGLGRRLEETWDAKAYSTYASSETVTTFCECAERNGGHLHPALGVVEIVDPDGKVLAPGTTGEVVVTPFLTRGMPLVRFRTGDVSFLLPVPCACGRGSVRLGPILGRLRQMIKCHGTTLYPQAIYAVLDDMPGISDYYVVVSGDFKLSDEVAVFVSLKDRATTAEAVTERLQARLQVKPAVSVVDSACVRERVYAEGSRKPVRFFDERRA